MRTSTLLEKLRSFPGGLWLFSRAICLKAPYFGSIRPTFTKLENGKAEARMSKRWAVTNHIGTVHAIAMANLCEFVAGVTIEVFLPPSHRWIPKGMKIDYLARGETNLRAVTELKLDGGFPDAGGVPMEVSVLDAHDKVVSKAVIEMWVTKKKG